MTCNAPKSYRTDQLETIAAQLVASALSDHTAREMLNSSQQPTPPDAREPERARLNLELDNLRAAVRVGAITPSEMIRERAPIDRALLKLEQTKTSKMRQPASNRRVSLKTLERVKASRGQDLHDILEALSVKFALNSDDQLMVLELSVPRDYR